MLRQRKNRFWKWFYAISFFAYKPPTRLSTASTLELPTQRLHEMSEVQALVFLFRVQIPDALQNLLRIKQSGAFFLLSLFSNRPSFLFARGSFEQIKNETSIHG